jgi:osmoprotectant transport system substrate-binding protein
MGTEARRAQVIAVVLVALGVGLAIAGCGGSDSSINKGQVTLTVRLQGTPEKRLMNQIYVQALRAAGYRVKAAPTQEALGAPREFDAVKSGEITGYPEYLSTALFYDFEVEIDKLPAKANAAYEAAKQDFEKQGLTAFPPTPFGIANAVGLLRKTAEERGLKTDSDLKGKAEGMTVEAPTYCHLSLDCIGGLEQYYGAVFGGVGYETFRSLELAWSRGDPSLRYKTLEDEEADASMVFTTDGRLAAEKNKFVILEDDKHVFPAGNMIWVTSPKVVDEAGPDYEKAIVDAQKGLTLETIRKLNAKMELEKKPAAKVAAEYLKSAGYTG